MTLVSLAALALGVTLVMPRFARRPRAAAPPPEAHPAMALDAKASYERGTVLARENQSVAALPYFEHATALRPEVWAGQVDFATAMFNAAFEAADRRGRKSTWTRSSYERVHLMRRALERLDLAPALSPGAHELAYVYELRGRFVSTWGLTHDARLAFGDALALDPASPAGPAYRMLTRSLGFETGLGSDAR